ncbi:MAG: MASE3 domain-containing protein [Anaerolineaceae bacterium]
MTSFGALLVINLRRLFRFISKYRLLMAVSVLILVALYFIYKVNFLLFHNLAEIFSILVAGAIFMFFWNARRYLNNGYYLFIGIAFAFVAVIDLLHTLAYAGMGVIPGSDTNLGAQLWILGRYVEAGSFLIAPFLLQRRVKIKLVAVGFLILVSFGLLSIFLWKTFPITFVDGVGLTPFKIFSEILISVLFCLAALIHYQKRKNFDKNELLLLIAALGAGVVSELFFTSYMNAYSANGFIGHLFKILSFYLIYRAFIAVSLVKPYNLLFRDLKQTETALRESKNRLDGIIRVAPVGIMLIINGMIEEANEYLFGLLGYSHEDLLNQKCRMIFPNQVCDEHVILKSGNDSVETQLKHKDGHLVNVILRSVFLDPENSAAGEIFSILDISERIQGEQALRESEHKFHLLADHSNDWDYWVNPEGKYLYQSPAFERITGYKIEEFNSNPDMFFELMNSGESEKVRLHFKNERDNQNPLDALEFSIKNRNGEMRTLSHECIPVFDDQGKFLGRRGSNRDITIRTQALEKLKQYAGQLETINMVTATLSTSLELEKVLDIILDQIGKVIQFDSGTIFLNENNQLKAMADRGISPSNAGKSFLYTNQLFEEISHTNKPLILNDAIADPRFENWGHGNAINSWIGVPLIAREKLIGYLTLESLKEKAYNQEQIDLLMPFASQAAQAIENARQFRLSQSRMERIDALREIDQAITRSFDIQVTMNILLKHLLEKLNIDAAVVLVYDPDLQKLTFSDAQGFLTSALRHTNLELGRGYAGQVALHRRDIHIPSLEKENAVFDKSLEFKEEGFVSYYGLPLVAKNTLMGVLEIFHRSELILDEEIVEYLHVLAGQAAIAIDNSLLFENLQKSNLRLSQAYESTIEGWALAMELKDAETEGHSRRVVEMTLKLAKVLGYHGEMLMHIRRGALLHDIGKMKIPDAILQKPGPLDAEEWKIMRMHPEYAFEWLSKIEYLRPSLAIPHYHHEKWDGSGYPQGLTGIDIPLEARIFAVVDVWDALRADRPYRKAWPQEKVIAHIKEQSGIHFDPQVVDQFLMILASDRYEEPV